MKTERPIKDCLELLNRDIRIMNLATQQKTPSDSLTELFAVLDKIQENAMRQLVAESAPEAFQEVHCA